MIISQCGFDLQEEEESAIIGLSVFEIRENTFRTFEKGYEYYASALSSLFVVFAKHIRSSPYSARQP